MTRPRTFHASLVALLSAVALVCVQAAGPRAPAFTADTVTAAGAHAGKGIAQLYRQDSRVVRVLDRPAFGVDSAKVLAGILGWAPGLPVRLAPSIIAELARSPLVFVSFPGDRSSRGPPRA